MTTSESLATLAALSDLGVTRLVHFTPAKNLLHILHGGIRSSADLAANSPGTFDPTDVERFDRHPNHVCTTFQFPNPYYYKQARNKPDFRLFRDWICVLIDPSLAAAEGVLFSESNAATGSGSLLKAGVSALCACFGSPAGSRSIIRPASHHRGAGTDIQAEALLPGPIALSSISGVVVPSSDDVVQELGRLQLLGFDLTQLAIPFYIQPDWFNPPLLVSKIRNGYPLEPVLWSASVQSLEVST